MPSGSRPVPPLGRLPRPRKHPGRYPGRPRRPSQGVRVKPSTTDWSLPLDLIGQDPLQLPPGADAELGEHLAQVPFDRVGTAEELGEIVAVSLSFTLRCPQDGRARKPPSPGSCRLPPWRSGARSPGPARRQLAQAAASMPLP